MNYTILYYFSFHLNQTGKLSVNQTGKLSVAAENKRPDKSSSVMPGFNHCCFVIDGNYLNRRLCKAKTQLPIIISSIGSRGLARFSVILFPQSGHVCE